MLDEPIDAETGDRLPMPKKELRAQIKRLLALEKAMDLAKSRWEEDKSDKNWQEKYTARSVFYQNMPDMIKCIKNLWEELNNRRKK